LVRYVACMKNFRNECWILVGKPAEQELFCLLYCIWVDIIKTDITLVVCDSVTWIICALITSGYVARRTSGQVLGFV